MDATHKIANAIVGRLFVNGNGDQANRLVLEGCDGRDLGGWCKQAVVDVIVDQLKLTKLKEMKAAPSLRIATVFLPDPIGEQDFDFFMEHMELLRPALVSAPKLKEQEPA